MKEELVNKAYEVAKARYAEMGVGTEAVLQQLQDFHLSLHCWQADDVLPAISMNSVWTSSRRSRSFLARIV